MGELAETNVRLVKGMLVARFSTGQVSPESKVELRIGGKVVDTTRAAATAGQVTEITFPLPDAAQNDGVALLDLHLCTDGSHLARYTMFCGAALPEDPISSLALLQAEVQALKRAFMADAAVPKLTVKERPLLLAEAVEESLAALRGAHPDRATED